MLRVPTFRKIFVTMVLGDSRGLGFLMCFVLPVYRTKIVTFDSKRIGNFGKDLELRRFFLAYFGPAKNAKAG